MNTRNTTVTDYFYRPWLIVEKKAPKKDRLHEEYTTCESWEHMTVIIVVDLYYMRDLIG